MDEFNVEFFIATDKGEDIKFSSLNETEKKEWLKNMELKALSEYYNKKIKISNNKI